MRVYSSDGSFIDDPNDTEFGWFFKEIIIDETAVNYQQRNRDIRTCSFLRKSFKKDFINESVEYYDKRNVNEHPVKIMNPDIEIQPIKDYINCDDIINNLSSICNGEEFRNIENEKDKLANNMNPCSVEAKMLLCVIHHAKFVSLQKKHTSQELLKSINFKSSNLKFLLSEQNSDSSDEVCEVMEYGDVKEENMPSLMMDLISTNIDCNIDKLINLNDRLVQQQMLPQCTTETSDLGNSIPSSSSSRDEKYEKHNLHLPLYKLNILCTLGLTEEEKSIQNYCEETYDMHKELTIIKRCFKEFDNKLKELFKTVSRMNNDIKEELYLNDIIQLLQGDIRKVKRKKLPFRFFHENEIEPNLLV